MDDKHCHCVKCVCIRNYSDPYFPVIGLTTDQNTTNTDTFYAVCSSAQNNWLTGHTFSKHFGLVLINLFTS